MVTHPQLPGRKPPPGATAFLYTEQVIFTTDGTGAATFQFQPVRDGFTDVACVHAPALPNAALVQGQIGNTLVPNWLGSSIARNLQVSGPNFLQVSVSGAAPGTQYVMQYIASRDWAEKVVPQLPITSGSVTAIGRTSTIGRGNILATSLFPAHQQTGQSTWTFASTTPSLSSPLISITFTPLGAQALAKVYAVMNFDGSVGWGVHGATGPFIDGQVLGGGFSDGWALVSVLPIGSTNGGVDGQPVLSAGTPQEIELWGNSNGGSALTLYGAWGTATSFTGPLVVEVTDVPGS